MTIGRIDINEKDLPKICGAVIQLEERSDEVEDQIAVIEDDITAIEAAIASLGTGGSVGGSPGGRLTLQTLTPVMTTTQSAKTTIYYTPYNGGTIGLYGGTSFTATAFSELSVATTDTTKSPAAIGASKVNDWYVWLDGSTLRLSHGPDWTSDTVRSAGTALVMVNGILLNNASITNGPAASRGTYVGTTRSNASSKLDWIYGTNAALGGTAFLGVWNAYNRVNVSTMVGDTTSNWTYGGATVRSSNNSTAMRVNAVFGLLEDSVTTVFNCPVSGVPGAINGMIGVGRDVTNAFSGQWGFCQVEGNSQSAQGDPTPQLGFHFWQALENSSGATSTFYGNFPNTCQNGLFFTARM